jgi:hypothetical protein
MRHTVFFFVNKEKTQKEKLFWRNCVSPDGQGSDENA